MSLSAEDTDDDQEKTDEDSSDNKSKKDKADEDHSNTSSSTKNDKSNADSKMILMTAQMKHQVLREIINLRELDINNRLGLTF